MIAPIYARATALAALALALALTGCARPPQRLDLIPLEGQPLSRAVIDQRECETEFPYTREESTLQAYAACLIARGYISEVPLSASSGTKRITVYVRPDRESRTDIIVRSDISACQVEMQFAYRNASFAYALARELVAQRTFGGNMQRRELIQTFAKCMAPRGYAVGDERHDVMPGGR
jgi:hypothetical protein